MSDEFYKELLALIEELLPYSDDPSHRETYEKLKSMVNSYDILYMNSH